MTIQLRRLVAVSVALAVLAAGLAYTLSRDPQSASHAAVVLVPVGVAQEDLPAVLEGFERAGTAGTFVELLSSGGVKAEAGSPPVSLTVRAVPASRVITIDATGPEQDVRPGLAAVIAAAQNRQADLRDLWQMRVLQAPNGPVASGPGTLFMVLAALILALLAGAVTWIVLGRIPEARPASITEAELGATEQLGAPEPLGRRVPVARDVG